VRFQQRRLDNGLTIIAETMDHLRSMALGFFVRAGARDETAEISGISHFLEHMIFKGTPKRSALEVNLEFDQMGAKYNAFTSEENTVFYAAVLPEYQQGVLELWSDLMRPALREDDFNTEKGVILEEIAMYKDMPQFDVMDRCRRLHFGVHGCGNSVLGTIESIKNLQSQQMLDYFRQRYSPDNMVLAAAGKVDWQQLVDQADKLCGGWSSFQPKRSLSHYPGVGEKQCVTEKKVLRKHICLMSAAPSAQDPLRYAAGVLANIIGDETGSRLYWSLVDTALADSAELECDAMDGTGVYYSYISCDPANTEKVVAIVRQMTAEIRQKGVGEEELTASKNKIASALTLSGELPMGRLVPLGFGWVYRQEYRPLTEELKAVQAVTTEDIRQLLEKYPLEKITILCLGPDEKKLV